jgi:hypothetical protein
MLKLLKESICREKFSTAIYLTIIGHWVFACGLANFTIKYQVALENIRNLKLD